MSAGDPTTEPSPFAELGDRYPLMAARFAALPDGDRHLRRLLDLDQAWARQWLAQGDPPVVVTRGEIAPPEPRDTFDIIYAGGGLNLLNAAVMTARHGRRVLVFDRFTVGAVHREWNIALDELRELVALGLLTEDDVAGIIQRRYTEGLVRFHGAGINVPRRDLWMRGVLDVAVDADALTALCLAKIRAARGDNVIAHDLTFERAVVGRDRAVVLARDAAGQQRRFAGQLVIDGMGATSPIARQLNHGAPFSLVCPTVGTVARGYRLSDDRAPGTVDPALGEILVTTEHERDGKQYIWETFPGKDGTVAIYLFYYAATDTPPAGDGAATLLPLFEEFFRALPAYKDTTDVTIEKPVYGFIPAGYKNPTPRARRRKTLAFDRVLSLGDAAALQSPLTFCGFGSNTRNLRRITELLNEALRHDRLRAGDLGRVRAAEAVPALARAFSKFMMGKPPGREPAEQVNETLNVFCAILDDMGERPAREFFQDRIRWWDYTRLVLRTARVYPRIFRLTARTLSRGDIAAWIGAYGVFSATALRNAVGRTILEPLSRTALAQRVDRWLWRRAPAAAWRLAAFGAGLRQALRVARVGA